MPFDPLSIIGYAGTTTGFLGFLVSTVDNLNTNFRHFKDCKEDLEWYEIKSQSTLLLLDHWKQKWCLQQLGGNASERQFQRFWGHAPYQAIRRRLECIQLQNRRVNRLIYALPRDQAASGSNEFLHERTPLDLQDQTNRWWQRVTESTSYSTRTYEQPPYPTIAYRICYALARHSTLKGHVGRLSEMVDDLCKFTDELFFSVHGIRATDLQAADVTRLSNIQNGFDRFSTFLTALHGIVKTPEPTWGLVLADLKLEQALKRMELPEDLKFTFRLLQESTTLANSATTQMVKVDLPMRQTLQEWYNMVLDPAANSSLSILRYNISSQICTKVLVWEASQGSRLARTGLRFIGMKSTLALVNSAVLLQKTPWLKNLCTCGVHHSPMDDDEEICVFKDVDCRLPLGGKCFAPKMAGRRFLLLGLALSELALSQPICFVTSEEDTALQTSKLQFYVGPRRELKSFEEVLILIRERADLRYKNAVRFCFEQDSESVERVGRPHNLQQCLKYLVKP